MNFKLTVPAEKGSLPEIRSFIREKAGVLQVEGAAVEDLVQAADEAATNTILHGYRGQPGEIEIWVDLEGESLVVCLRDHAPPYDPTQAPPCDLEASIDQRCHGGFGTHLMRQLTDSITYCLAADGYNELTLRRKAKGGG